MLDKRNIKNIYELTPMQEGMLFHALYDPASQAYFEQTHDRLHGPLRVEIFHRTWKFLVERHDILRTLFAHKNTAQPVQIVLKQRDFPFHCEDLRSLSPTDRETRIEEYKSRDRAELFDLSSDPLLRLAVFQCAEQSFDVIWSLHHILLDGWSLGVLQVEFDEIYAALAHGRRPELPAPIPFSAYIKWLKQQNRANSARFWSSYLKGYTQLASLPKKAPAEEGFEARTLRFFVDDELTRSVKNLLEQRRITLATLIQCVWGVLLGAYCGRRDVVFAATVSGRPPEIPDVERMVGLLINAVPVRVDFSKLENFTRLLERIQTEAGQSQSHHYYSLADIQAAHPLKQALFDHILVVENFPDDAAENQNKSGLSIEHSEHFDHTNYDLTVQVVPAERLGFNIIFNAAVYRPDLMQGLQTKLTALLAWAANTPEQGFPEVLSAPEKIRYAPAPQGTAQLTVAASFTAEPLEPYGVWWGKTFGWEFDIKFAAYNQVFQALLDPACLLRTRPGLACVLLRFEDWLREISFHSTAEAVAHLEQQYAQLTAAFAAASFRAPTVVVGIFPPAPHLGLTDEVVAHIHDLNRRWQAFLAQHQALVLDGAELARNYAVTEMFDPLQDRTGHLPFSDEYYAVLGTALARKLLAGHAPPFKVIAVDCDNTLWDGVCGELGATGVEVGPGHRALQQFLLDKREQGWLLAVNSKNNPDDAWAVFEHNPDMLLKREHFAAARINWQAKSQNLRELAQELDLGLSSFLFLDDSGLECSEVMNRCPEVLTLRLPVDPAAFPFFLKHLWGLDKLKITAEDRARSAMYQAEQQRRAEQAQALSLEDFLRGLEIQVYLGTVGDAQIERVAQLTQRTNQFNLSTIRRNEDEVRALLQNPSAWCRCLEVEDKFGRYGLVGVFFSFQRGAELFVDTLLLSCRVLGRKVEYALLASLREYCTTHDITRVTAEFRSTAKNRPVREFLEASGWHQGDAAPDGVLYYLDVAELPEKVEFVTVHEGLSATPPPASRSHAPRANAEAPRRGETSAPQRGATTLPRSAWERESHDRQGEAGASATGFPPFGSAQGWHWSLDTSEGMENLLHRAYYEPLRHPHAAALLKLPVEQTETAASAHFYAPPQTDTQRALCEIWQEILGLERVGIDDDFLDLGGHSLKATRIVSRVYKALGVDLSLRDVFEQPTVARLARLVERRQGTYMPIPPVPAQDDYPVLPAQDYVWRFEQIQPGTYNDAALYRMDGDLDMDALARAYAYVITRHEVLRTVFAERGGTVRQQVRDTLPFQLEFVAVASEAEAATRAAEAACVPFDLGRGPLLRIIVYKINEQRYALCLVIHHLISDGWSVAVLESEVLATYDAFRQGREPALPMSTHQHKDCVVWLNGRYGGDAERLTWWREYLKDAAAPGLFPEPVEGSSPSAGTRNFVLDLTVLAPIRDFCALQGVSLFTLLCTLTSVALYRYTGQRDLLLGTRLAGREHPDLEHQIGFYAMTVGLRLHYDPVQPFITLLEKNAASIDGAFRHALPFEQVATELGLAQEPLFQVLLVLQAEQTHSETHAAGLRIRALEDLPGTARFPLSLDFQMSPLGLRGMIHYNSALLSVEFIEHIETTLMDLCRKIPLIQLELE